MSFARELEVAKSAALEAGKVILSFYKKGISIQKKSDRTPVTEADLAADKIISEKLRKTFPYPILSEEAADDLARLKSDKAWIIDPLDGTKDFIAQIGEFVVMIGLAFKGRPVLGVVYCPTTGELYIGEKGRGSYLYRGKNSKKLRVSAVDDPGAARFLISRSHPTGTEIIQEVGGIECTMGSFGLKLAKIAGGEADVYLNFSRETSEWDTCAPEVILREAGGTVTDIAGNDLRYNERETKRKNGVLATNGCLHHLLVKHIASSRHELP